jgi:hypothetical protein
VAAAKSGWKNAPSEECQFFGWTIIQLLLLLFVAIILLV